MSQRAWFVVYAVCFVIGFAIGVALSWSADAQEQAPPLGIPPMQWNKDILCWPSKLFDREFQFYQAEGEPWLSQGGKYLYQFFASPEERVLVLRDATAQMSCVIDFENLGKAS
jgi:hypothetical protein